MAELKTKPHDGDVLKFINSVDNEKRRKDALVVLEIMKEITREKPVMWGPGIIGFGSYHYKYESGQEGDMPLIGFSPRKQSLTLYVMSGFEREKELMEKLGKYKTGKSCLYVNKLEDIDVEILKELIAGSVKYMKDKYH